MTPPSAEELEALGVLDPSAPDAAERLQLIQYALERGATIDDVAAATNLGELALDMHLRPRTATTLGDVVARLGLDWEWARRLLDAIGLESDPDVRLTADEIATLELLADVGSQLLGEDATAQLGRVAGAAMARVAESIVTAFRLRFELPQRAAGTPYVDVVKSYASIAETMLPAFVSSLDVMLRRQIVAVADRVWSTDEEQSTVTLPRTVGFADLVGFTELTGTLSVGELTAVLVAFDERVAEVVVRGRGQIVKTIGDEVLFVTEDPADACRIALDLIAAFATGDLPPVRVGLATGEVVSVFGDVFGPDVNLAARLVRLAEPSTAVVSERTSGTCAGGFTFEPLGPQVFKGFAAPVGAFRLLAAAPGAAEVSFEVVDPEDDVALLCLGQYYGELDRRFESGFDPAASLLTDADDVRLPAGLFVVATAEGSAVACGALRFHGDEPTEIKRMWVSPSVRGQGVGKRLLAELERRAAEHGSRVVRLETNRALREAIALYRANGYREVEPFNDEVYGDHWFEKDLDR